METKIFLCWSGPKSKAVASTLRDWLPQVIQTVLPWMSDKDIEVGSVWDLELTQKLEEATLGIICITDDNLSAPWLLFETGALFHRVGNDSRRVCPYLLNIEHGDIQGPLSILQMAKANEEGTYRLLETINKNLKSTPLKEDILKTVFEKFWPDLEKELQKIIATGEPITLAKRPTDDMIPEILELVRELSRKNSFIDSPIVAALTSMNSPAGIYGGSRKLTPFEESAKELRKLLRAKSRKVQQKDEEVAERGEDKSDFKG
ncbi:MAG: TIR domain-containing protein [bacterium]